MDDDFEDSLRGANADDSPSRRSNGSPLNGTGWHLGNGAAPSEEQLTALLVEYDEALAAGDTAAAIDTKVPNELAAELASLQECVRLLDAARVQRGRRDAIDSLTPLAGERIGRFELLRELGHGGYGVVFLARDPRLDRPVALKVPRPEALVTPELRRRFLREAQAAGRLSHAHLVRVHEVGEDGALCYLVSEYCQGPSLARWLKQSDVPASNRAIAALLADLADGLEHAHREGVLHRDIKPGNVLLEPTDGCSDRTVSIETLPLSSYTAKLTDFGLAKMLAVHDNETRSGAQLGTPAYMPPEQAVGRLDQIGPPADVYGLGAILYELLTRRAPFVGSSDAETIHQVIAVEPVAPRKLRPDVPADLEAICLKCLEKKPAARYASCAALAADLRRFLAGESTLARPAGSAERLLKWSRRRPAVAALLAVSLLATVTIVGGSAVYSRRLLVALNASEQSRASEARAREEAETHRQTAEGSRNEALRERDGNEQYAYAGRMHQAFQALALGDVKQVAKSLDQYDDGTPYASLRGFEWYYLKQSLHGERLMLRGHKGEVYGVAFSPDGRFLVSGGEDGTIRLWDPNSGQELRTIRAHTSCTNDLDFSPDGRLLASASCDHTLKTWDTRIWLEVNTFAGHEHDVLCVAFSPDGQRLASGDSSGRTCIWTVDEGKRPISIVPELPPKMTALGAVNSVAWAPDGKLLLAPTSDRCWLWDATSWTPMRSWPAARLHTASISPDGQRIAYETLGEIRILDLGANVTAARFSGLVRSVQQVIFSADGRQLFSCGDGAVRIWDLPSDGGQKSAAGRSGNEQQATEARALIGHTGRVQDLAISPDGRTLATASFDGTVGMWDLVAQGVSSPVLKCSTRHGVTPLALVPDLSRIMFLSDDDRIVTWDVVEGRQIRSKEVAPREHRSIALSPDGDTFIVRDVAPARLLLGRVGDARPPVTLATPPAEFLGYSISGNCQFVAIVTTDNWVRVIHVQSGQEKYSFDPSVMSRPGWNFAEHTALALSSDGRRIAYTNAGEAILDLETGERTELPHIEGTVAEIGFSPDDRLLFARNYSGIVQLIDVETGTILRTLRLSTGMNIVAFSPDSRTLAIAAAGKVTLWHIETGQEMGSVPTREKTGDIVKLQFSADGRKLAAVTIRPIGDATAEASLYIW